VATTIVSSTMLEMMARSSHVRFVTTLTGFKWIARAAGGGVLRFGYEEALVFAVDPLVADKDGMSAALAICQLADDLARSGATLLDRLDEIESRYGVHAGGQLSLRVDGPGGALAIDAALRRLRSSPPTTLGHLPVSSFVNLDEGWHGLPPTEGVLMELRESGRVVVRPSGTEAKLKVYIEITASPDEGRSLDEQRKICGALLASVREEIAELLRL
jgi:phosphomannomutase